MLHKITGRATKCGPSTISAIAGVPTHQAAAVIRRLFERRAVNGVFMDELAAALHEFGWEPDYALRHPKFRDRRYARREAVWERIFANVPFDLRAVTLQEHQRHPGPGPELDHRLVLFGAADHVVGDLLPGGAGAGAEAGTADIGEPGIGDRGSAAARGDRLRLEGARDALADPGDHAGEERPLDQFALTAHHGAAHADLSGAGDEPGHIGLDRRAQARAGGG